MRFGGLRPTSGQSGAAGLHGNVNSQKSGSQRGAGKKTAS